MKWLSSAPANLMIMGEHSVVYGHKAIATAINQRLTVRWQTRDDQQIHIHSALGNYQTELFKQSALPAHPKLQWMIACLNYFKDELKQGLTLEVESEFDATLGLGSSAAVLAAMIGGMQFYLQQHTSLETKFKIGLEIIHQIQQRGSGTDLAASLAGGIILFDPDNSTNKSINTPTISQVDCADLSLNLIYCGYKTPTAEVLKLVHDNWFNKTELLQSLYQIMGKTTELAFEAIQQNNLHEFYQLANHYQGLMDTLGVNDLMLSRIVYETRAMPNIHASKISGSGLGDCVLSFGELDNNQTFINQLNPMSVKTSATGLLCEEL